MIIYTIKKIITAVFNFIYKILSFFNLQYLLLALLIGLILLIVGVFENYTILLIFNIVVVFTIVLAIVLTVKRLLGLGGKKKSKGVYLGDNREGKEDKSTQQNITPNVNNVGNINTINSENVVDRNSQNIVDCKPVYYAIKGRKGYYMAEFSDRYELYYNKDGTLVRVRTDYKVGR